MVIIQEKKLSLCFVRNIFWNEMFNRFALQLNNNHDPETIPILV